MSESKEMSHEEFGYLCVDDFINYFRYLMLNNQGSELQSQSLWAIHSGARAYNTIFSRNGIEGVTREEFLKEMDESVKFFVDRNCTYNAYLVGSHMKENKELIFQALIQTGWHQFDPIIGMYKVMDNFVPFEIELPDGFIIESANDGVNNEVFGQIVPSAFLDNPYERDCIEDVGRTMKSYKDSNWSLFVGKVNGVIASTISFSLNEELGFGSIHTVVTKKEFQRRGYASLLMNYVMNLIHELGMKYCILQSEPGAIKVYEKKGFISCVDINVFSPHSKI